MLPAVFVLAAETARLVQVEPQQFGPVRKVQKQTPMAVRQRHPHIVGEAQGRKLGGGLEPVEFVNDRQQRIRDTFELASYVFVDHPGFGAQPVRLFLGEALALLQEEGARKNRKAREDCSQQQLLEPSVPHVLAPIHERRRTDVEIRRRG